MSGVVLGIGGRESAEPQALLDLVAKVLAEVGLTPDQVETLGTLESRVSHPGIGLLAITTDAGIRGFTAEELATQPVEHASPTVDRHTGTPSVAEAAVRILGGEPIGTPHKADSWVVVVGRTKVPPRRAITAVSRGQERAYDLGHHGDTEVTPGMLDFAVNVHGAEPPAFLAEALAAAIKDLARYPDPREAQAAVAAAHGVPTECVLLTHGAAEAFTLVAQQPWRSPAVVHPQFTEPEAALVAAGHPPHRILLDPAEGFRLAPDFLSGLGEGLIKADLVVIGNPTNPTSRLHTRAEIEALAAPGRLVFVDEAFLDAVEPVDTPVHSLAHRAATDERFLVARSLTKTYAIAGLRVGYLIGHPRLLQRLASRRTPWPVGTLAAVAAQACLSAEGQAYAAQVRAGIPARVEHLTQVLSDAGFAVVPEPRAPFVLARHPEAMAIRQRLREQDIAVRRADTFPGLDPTWLRFAARDRSEVAALSSALGQLGR